MDIICNSKIFYKVIKSDKSWGRPSIAQVTEREDSVDGHKSTH